MSNAPLDENSRHGLFGLSSTGDGARVDCWVNPDTHALLTGDSTLSGPVSSTDNAIVRWNGTSGLTVQDSKVLVDDNGLVSTYANVATTGYGVPAIYGYGRSTAQTAAVASVATYTVGASDGSFLISGNANVTAYTAGTFTVQVVYKDETNTTQTVNLQGHLTSGYGVNISGSGAFEIQPIHIRALAGSTITIKTAGTFTNLTYNIEGIITQIA